MLENAEVLLQSPVQLMVQQLDLAQVFVDTVPPEVASLMFSGPHFWVALLAGVMMAFGFQLLLTNLSVAFVISPVGDGVMTDDLDESLGKSIRRIETKVGLWALFTASLALFAACFLAVKLSLVTSTFLGIVVGVVIWSIYFSLLLWIGSTAVGSVLGSIVSTAAAGVQGLMGTATTALGANAAKSQVVSTAEEITAAVRRELTAGITPDAIQTNLQSALDNLKLPRLDPNQIRQQFEKILNNSDLKELADSDLLKVDRQTLVNLISSRTDFSKQEVDQIADQLEAAWKVVKQRQTPANASTNGNHNGGAEAFKPDQITQTFSQLVAANMTGDQQKTPLTTQAINIGLGALLTGLRNNINLKDLPVEHLPEQLQEVMNNAMKQVGQVGNQIGNSAPAAPSNPIKADVEHYVIDSFPWHLNRLTVGDEFREVIFDPDANPSTVRQQLEALHQNDFTNLLTRRGDLSPARVQETAELMESIRQEVLEQVRQTEIQEQSHDLRTRLENYLRATGKAELNSEAVEYNLQQILTVPETEIDQLETHLERIDRAALFTLLQQRQDIDEPEINRIVNQVETVRDQVLNTARQSQEQTQKQTVELRQKVEAYLRDTGQEELNPDGIQRDFQALFDDPQVGLDRLRSRLSQFDRDTLVKLLSQRQDLSEQQVNQIIDQILAVRDNILQTPRQWAGKTKEQYDQTLSKITEYLHRTNLEELDPEGIQRDLKTLFDDPQMGATALRDRLAQVDRETLVKLLSQRQDLSEEQVNRAIDQVESAIQHLVRAPQRLASRTQKRLLDFEANLESYLRNTQKEELNPEGIKRDLQRLLNHPSAGLNSITDRLSQFDRSTLVALLAQREDLSEAEANQIVDQILSVRDRLVEQTQQIQQRAQAAIDNTFDRIRTYLNSLDRTELNYEGIRHDFVTLFDDPQMGLEALRNRLGQFDRETLVALLSSREDLSQADAERIVGQIESARDQVLHRTEQIQQEVQQRLSQLKQQAQQQVIETRKVTAGAAWWLFGTGLASLAAAAVAGAVAVSSQIGLGI